MSELVAGHATVEVSPSFKGFVTESSKEATKAGDASARAYNQALEKGTNQPGRFKAMGSSMASHVGGAFKVGLGAAGLAGAGLISTALTKGFSRLTAIDEAKAKLTGLGNSASSVDAIMKNAMASVKGTAFGMGEAATTAAGATAAGVKPGKELERTLKLTADAATIAGTDMATMGSIFNKVATSNKIQGDVIAQLSDAGIPVVQMLSKELGKSSEEVVALASKGKINFAQFQNAMEQGLGGAAASSGKTFSGAMKNFQASLGRIGANFMGGIFPKLAPGLSNLTKAMEPLEAKAKVLGNAMGAWVDKGVQKMPQVIAAVKGFYGLLSSGDPGQSLAKAFGEDEANRIVITFYKVKGAISDVFSTFKAKSAEGGGAAGVFDKIAGAAKQFVSNFDPSQLTNIFSSLGSLAPVANSGLQLFGTILGTVADHADLVAKALPFVVAAWAAHRAAMAASNAVGRTSIAGFWAQTTATTLNAVAVLANRSALQQSAIATYANSAGVSANTAATQLNTAANNQGILARIRERVATAASTAASWAATAAQRAMAAGQWLLNAALNANPISLIILGLVAFGAALVVAWKKSDTFRAIVTGAWNAIKAAALFVWNWMKTALWPGLKSVWDGLSGAFTSVKDKIVGAWNAIKGKFTSVWNWMSSTFRGWWNGVKMLLVGPINWAKNEIHRRWENIKANFTAVWNWLSGTFSRSWAGLKKLLTAPVDAAKTAISGIFGKDDKSGLRGVFNDALTAVKKIWEKLKDIVAKPINGVIGIINNPFIKGFNKIGGMVGLTIPEIPTIPAKADGGLVSRAGGGPIPGPWRGPKADNVLGVGYDGVPTAWVNPREYVTNVAATERMNRNFPGALDYINRYGSLPGFADGGIPKTGMSWQWQWEQIRSRFPTARMTSNYRPGARTHGFGNMSYHAIGRAIDIDGSPSTMAAVARWIQANYLGQTHDLLYTPLWGSQGFYKGKWSTQPASTVADHRNHVHWGLEGNAEKGKSLWGKIVGGLSGLVFDKLKGPAFKLIDGAVGKFGGGDFTKKFLGGLAKKLIEKAISFGNDSGGGSADAAPSDVSGAVALGKQMAAARGWTGNEWNALYQLWQRESGWRVNADNPTSDAYGIPQALPGSKMATAGSDWRTNAATQIKWGMDYIAGRPDYGTPSRAWAKWQSRSPHWYADGGIVEAFSKPIDTRKVAHYAHGGRTRPGLAVVGEYGPELVRFDGGERVTSAQEMAGGGGQINHFHGIKYDSAAEVARELNWETRRLSHAGPYGRV